MSYDNDEESAFMMSQGRNSVRYSTMSTMITDYDQKLTNISMSTLKEENLMIYE